MKETYKKGHSYVPFLFAVFFLQACSTQLPSQSISYFEQCRDDEAIHVLSKMKVKEKDLLLYDLALLSIGVHSNQTDLGIRHGTRALSNMWTLGDVSRGKASMASSEAARDYKGDPFEKSMAGIYLGILFFNEADYDNARASFQKAVMGNQFKSEKAQENLPLAHFLLARTFSVLGQEDNARVSLEKAKQFSPLFSTLELEDIKELQTILIVEQGKVPQKVRRGPGNSLIDFQKKSGADMGARFWIDQQLIGQTNVVEDLYQHAKENERGGKNTLQATKGVVRDASTIVAIQAASQAGQSKEAGSVAVVAGLLALANQSQADTRQWQMLPEKLGILWSKKPVEDKEHRFSVDFIGRGQPLTWVEDRKKEQPKIYIKKPRNCYK